MNIQLRWLGHAAFQIKAAGKTIYLDPRHIKSLESGLSSFFDNPGKADIIVITFQNTCLRQEWACVSAKDAEGLLLSCECDQRVGHFSSDY